MKEQTSEYKTEHERKKRILKEKNDVHVFALKNATTC